MKSYHIIVHGRVQGVGFRFFTAQKANALGLMGNVKNLNDGTVEVNVSGDSDQVQAFLEWIHKGPETAIVDQLNYKTQEPFQADSFSIIR